MYVIVSSYKFSFFFICTFCLTINLSYILRLLIKLHNSKMKWLDKLCSPAIAYSAANYQMLEYWIMWQNLIQCGVTNLDSILHIHYSSNFSKWMLYSKRKGDISLIVSDFSFDAVTASFHFPPDVFLCFSTVSILYFYNWKNHKKTLLPP